MATRLYGIGFNEFRQLKSSVKNVSKGTDESKENEKNENETKTENHIHSTPIEMQFSSLVNVDGRQVANRIPAIPSSIAIAWDRIAYRFGDGSLEFSSDDLSFPDGSTSRVKSMALSWNAMFIVTPNGRCMRQEFSDTSKYSVVVAGAEQGDPVRSNFVSVSCGNMHCIATDDTGVPWLIQPDETNQPECSKAGDTSTCVATDPRTATDPAVIASRDRPANGSGDGGGGGGHLVLLSRPLGEHLKVKVVSCGNEHVLLLSRIGLVFSLGIGSRGQLGHGDTDNQSEPRMVESIEAVSMVTVASGGWHSMALSDIGDVYVWGWNSSGQLGLPCQAISGVTKRPHTEPMGAAVDAGGATGGAPAGEMVNLQTVPAVLEFQGEENVTAISCGSRHSAAVTDCGELWTWGWNAYGQLGHSDTLGRDRPRVVDHFRAAGARVTSVFAGYWNTLVIARDRA